MLETYQKFKMKQFTITTEEPSIHWPKEFINIKGENILDYCSGITSKYPGLS